MKENLNTKIISNKVTFNKDNIFEQRLDDIVLSNEKEISIKKKKSLKIIQDKILGSFLLSDIINTTLNWNNEINDEIRKEKERILISKYFEKTDNNENSIKKLVEILSNPSGNALFNKILSILNDSPLDNELINHLSNVLKNISMSDFVNLFDKHKTILNIINNLTIQGLTILKDYKNWSDLGNPEKRFTRFVQVGKIVTPWSMQFAKVYSISKNINIDNKSIINGINYSVINLINNGLIEGVSDGGSARAEITDIGIELIEYLD